jgi:hypothetical protein
VTLHGDDEVAHATRTLLWHWHGEADDSDAEQRGWKRSRLEGMLLACERTGVLAAPEIERWRALASRDDASLPASADNEAINKRLSGLMRDLRPMTRDEDPDRLRASRRFHGALQALADSGLIDHQGRSIWHERALAAEAPWLPSENVEQLVAGGGFFAIGVPARTPGEDAADEIARREYEKLMRRGTLRSVALTRTPDRHEGLAVFGVVARSECTEVLFHLVGPPQGEFDGGFADLSAHSALVEGLVPPELTDDVATRYEPVARRPLSTHGAGGTPDPDRPRVLTGVWRYLPSAPDSAVTFVASLGSVRWTIG